MIIIFMIYLEEDVKQLLPMLKKTEELKPCGLENEQEKTLPLWISFDDINKMIRNNEIFDAKTIIGLSRINNG